MITFPAAFCISPAHCHQTQCQTVPHCNIILKVNTLATTLTLLFSLSSILPWNPNSSCLSLPCGYQDSIWICAAMSGWLVFWGLSKVCWDQLNIFRWKGEKPFVTCNFKFDQIEKCHQCVPKDAFVWINAPEAQWKPLLWLAPCWLNWKRWGRGETWFS